LKFRVPGCKGKASSFTWNLKPGTDFTRYLRFAGYARLAKATGCCIDIKIPDGIFTALNGRIWPAYVLVMPILRYGPDVVQAVLRCAGVFPYDID
jgi:hypothetical protein